mmetsp:Transcript_22387/g.30601  ORF Transcript_22387/g.30601 Transcript_22387/m.30601 type:complete len:128 (-) Transcript_22387:163-546(-)
MLTRQKPILTKDIMWFYPGAMPCVTATISVSMNGWEKRVALMIELRDISRYARRMHRYGYTLDLLKCSVFVKEVTFFGYVIKCMYCGSLLWWPAIERTWIFCNTVPIRKWFLTLRIESLFELPSTDL